jgi:hypothetical protein
MGTFNQFSMLSLLRVLSTQRITTPIGSGVPQTTELTCF